MPKEFITHISDGPTKTLCHVEKYGKPFIVEADPRRATCWRCQTIYKVLKEEK